MRSLSTPPRHDIRPDHIRASASLLPIFPAVEMGERLLGDAGISANLPIDMILSEFTDRPLLCIAVDLLPLGGGRPRSLGETADRMQDLLFASACPGRDTDMSARIGGVPNDTIRRSSCGAGATFDEASGDLID
jgi:predicted acylesterase/phospholipase RssA